MTLADGYVIAGFALLVAFAVIAWPPATLAVAAAASFWLGYATHREGR